MNIFVLILVGVAGVVLGTYLARRGKTEFFRQAQSRKKAENKEKVLELLQKNRKVKNNDVEKLLGVSDSTAERYLNELEKEGKITQHGQIGQGVFYTEK